MEEKKVLTKQWLKDFAKSNNVMLRGIIGGFVCKMYGDNLVVCNRINHYEVSKKNAPQAKLSRFSAAGFFARFVYSIPFIKELWKEWYPFNSNSRLTGDNYYGIRNGVPTNKCSLVPEMRGELKPAVISISKEGIKLQFDREIKGDIAVVISLFNNKNKKKRSRKPEERNGDRDFMLMSAYGRGEGLSFESVFDYAAAKVIEQYDRAIVYVVNIDEKGAVYQGAKNYRIMSSEERVRKEEERSKRFRGYKATEGNDDLIPGWGDGKRDNYLGNGERGSPVKKAA